MNDRDGQVRPDSGELRLDALLDDEGLRRSVAVSSNYLNDAPPDEAPRSFLTIGEENGRRRYYGSGPTGCRSLDEMRHVHAARGCDVHIVESTTADAAIALSQPLDGPRRRAWLVVPWGDLEAGVAPLAHLLVDLSVKLGETLARYEMRLEGTVSR